MDNVLPKCVVCGENPESGLYDGIRIAKKFICSTCEGHIVTSVPGTEEYENYLRSLKKVIYTHAI